MWSPPPPRTTLHENDPQANRANTTVKDKRSSWKICHTEASHHSSESLFPCVSTSTFQCIWGSVQYLFRKQSMPTQMTSFSREGPPKRWMCLQKPIIKECLRVAFWDNSRAKRGLPSSQYDRRWVRARSACVSVQRRSKMPLHWCVNDYGWDGQICE